MKTVKGDLIKLAEEGHFDIIIHGCNCFHTMGSGIAFTLARKYPEVPYADRRSTVSGDISKLGDYTVAPIYKEDGRTLMFKVFNVYTQYHISRWGQDVFEYHAFQKFLSGLALNLKNAYQHDGISPKKLRIGFPMIGAGYAGGDWSLIESMIKDFSEKVNDYAEITIVEYNGV